MFNAFMVHKSVEPIILADYEEMGNFESGTRW